MQDYDIEVEIDPPIDPNPVINLGDSLLVTIKAKITSAQGALDLSVFQPLGYNVREKAVGLF